MLDSLHVPLVDNNNYFLTICLVDLPEEILISLVNHYLFNLGEEDVGRLDVPVHFIGVEHFLSVRLRTRHRKNLAISDGLP